MNAASLWRKEYAERLAAAYAENAKVAAVMLSGSSARGHADMYSDIEVVVFWRDEPTEQDRLEAAHRAGADVHRLFPYEEEYRCWSDDLFMGHDEKGTPKSGMLVEVVHQTVEAVETTLEDVLVRFDPDANKQLLLSGIEHGLELAGSGTVAPWKEKVKTYPDGLVQSVVERHAWIDHYQRWPMWLERENLMMLEQHLVQVEQKLLQLLLALNRTYFFGFKWTNVILDCFKVAPRDFPARFKRIHQLPYPEAAKELAALVEETYDLIEQNVPSVDIDRIREIFRYQRPVWKETPPTA